MPPSGVMTGFKLYEIDQRSLPMSLVTRWFRRSTVNVAPRSLACAQALRGRARSPPRATVQRRACAEASLRCATSRSRSDSTATASAACGVLPLPPGGRKKLDPTCTSSSISAHAVRAQPWPVVGHASAPLHERRKVLFAFASVPFESARTRQVTKLAGPPSLRKMLPVMLMMLFRLVEYKLRVIVQRSAPRSLLTM